MKNISSFKPVSRAILYFQMQPRKYSKVHFINTVYGQPCCLSTCLLSPPPFFLGYIFLLFHASSLCSLLSSSLPPSHLLKLSLPTVLLFQSPNQLASPYPPFPSSPPFSSLTHHFILSSPPSSSTGALPPVSL